MKKGKLSLKNLKVSSFITQQKDQLKGGRTIQSIKTINDPTANTGCFDCPPDLTFD